MNKISFLRTCNKRSIRNKYQLMKSKFVKSRIEIVAIDTFDHKVGVVRGQISFSSVHF